MHNLVTRSHIQLEDFTFKGQMENLDLGQSKCWFILYKYNECDILIGAPKMTC